MHIYVHSNAQSDIRLSTRRSVTSRGKPAEWQFSVRKRKSVVIYLHAKHYIVNDQKPVLLTLESRFTRAYTIYPVFILAPRISHSNLCDLDPIWLTRYREYLYTKTRRSRQLIYLHRVGLFIAGPNQTTASQSHCLIRSM
jgi:hypothetical protein